MIEQLEAELREALSARASQLPRQAGARLRQMDYRPRSRGVRPSLALGAFAAAAGTAAAAISIVGLGADTPTAFAGWTPSPTSPSNGQLASAEATCRARLAANPGPVMGSVAGLPVRLTDTRGPFTFAVLANDRASASCISGPSFTSISGSASTAPVDLPAGHVTLSTEHLTTRNGQAYAFAEGRTGSGVTATTLMLDDRTRVKATTANGWFVAWWPGTHEVTAAEVTTANGVTKQPFDSRRPGTCGQAPGGTRNLCTGGSGASGGASASGGSVTAGPGGVTAFSGRVTGDGGGLGTGSATVSSGGAGSTASAP